jgi:hypothetical protein
MMTLRQLSLKPPNIPASTALRDRDEEELRGYHDALNLIHHQGKDLSVSEEVILRLHHLCRSEELPSGFFPRE